MTDEGLLLALASVRAQIGALQAQVDMMGRALEERVLAREQAKAAIAECQHHDTEDAGSTLRLRRRRCMNPQCRKVIEEAISGGDA